jgi:hypothetical protein
VLLEILRGSPGQDLERERWGEDEGIRWSAVDKYDTNNNDVRQLMTNDEKSLVVGLWVSNLSRLQRATNTSSQHIPPLCSILLKSCPSYPL